MGKMNLSRRKFVMLGGATAASAALVGLAGCGSNNASSSASNSTSKAKTVESDLASMSWDDVLAEAKGQTVTFLAWGSSGADPFVQQWWDKLAEDVKSKYDVTIKYSEFDQAEYAKITTDLQNGTDATYDMFWYTGAMTAPIRAAGKGVFGNSWVEKLDNYQYLDPNNNYVTFDGAAATDGEEAPFQGLNPSLVYSADLWDHKLAWNATEGGKKGLPSNFTELAAWTAANPGKFSYMDLTGAGSFHGLFFLKAILAELTSDGAGGWKAVYDESDNASTRRKKIEDNIEQWYTWSMSSQASEQAFYEKADYLWAYLRELAPNLLQGDGGPAYMATAPDMMQRVIAGDLACTFTTCTSVSERVAAAPDSYMKNPAIYMLQTSVGAWDYSVIMSNAKAKAAAMVVANEMLDPSQQAIAFQTTGNGYNVDYDKLNSSQKKEFDDVIKAMGTLSPSTEEIAQQSYTDKFGVVAQWIPTGWAQRVQATA
ncbi:MAG: hypothetical protein IJ087_11980 [Eggerthellaceae bacterium]|nr:hypothetical protein [Eggerthellaceae bacterium]